MKTSKSFLELEKRIKDEKIVLDAVGKSVLKKISKCSEEEVHDYVKKGVIPALKLSEKEMKVIKAGFLPVDRPHFLPTERPHRK